MVFNMIRIAIIGFILLLVDPIYEEQPDKADVQKAMKRAATYYREQVARHGGYVYYYSPDLQQSWGEGATDRTTIFVQPPGTPTVGQAYLQAYAATNDSFYLDAARETAMALVNGQLESGGWSQAIYFAENKRMGHYRTRKGGSWNKSSLDDNQTQAALQFLMATDQALKFQDAIIHEAVEYGLDGLLQAQYANGGFSQVWNQPAATQPILKAHYPDYNWKTEGRVKNYWDYYTLNDKLAGTVCDTLIQAYRTYKDKRYLKALEQLGDFLILAQMPEPQPGWCQQYNYDMVPIWARKFEPPAIAGSESKDVMKTLIAIARITGDKKYLEPIPKVLHYFKTNCLLKNEFLARYYELKTNTPIYMDADYHLTYDGTDAPSHYGWQQPARFDVIEKAYRLAIENQPISSKPKKVQAGYGPHDH